MIFPKKYLDSCDVILVSKYTTASVVSFVSIFALMFIFVDILKIGLRVSYFIIYIFAYIADYLINLKIIFLKTHNMKTVKKYLLQLPIFFVLRNVLFNFFTLFAFFKVNYILSTILVVAILFPLRFLVQKNIIYK